MYAAIGNLNACRLKQQNIKEALGEYDSELGKGSEFYLTSTGERFFEVWADCFGGHYECKHLSYIIGHLIPIFLRRKHFMAALGQLLGELQTEEPSLYAAALEEAQANLAELKARCPQPLSLADKGISKESE